MERRMAVLERASGGAAVRAEELAQKTERLAEWLDAQQLDGILLRRHDNLAWMTAGQVEARVGIVSVTGVVTLLVLRDGRRFYLAPNNEADRLAEEEFTGLKYEPVVRPWHALDVVAEAERITPGKLAADDPMGGLPVVSLAALRAPLTAGEMARYRVLGADTARIVGDAVLTLEQGTSEHAMEADLAARLLGAGIFPSVLLMATDARILRYKHAVARDGRLERFGMINLCTRRWGLAVSITRFVHFGEMPQELAYGFAAAAQVNAALQHATRAGASAGELFAVAAKAYADAGFPGEEQKHHQGGACGYLEREWVATLGGRQVVQTPGAFAWNPSCRGGKVEDTTLATAECSGSGVELLTATAGLPQVTTRVDGTEYVSAGPLVRA